MIHSMTGFAVGFSREKKNFFWGGGNLGESPKYTLISGLGKRPSLSAVDRQWGSAVTTCELCVSKDFSGK